MIETTPRKKACKLSKEVDKMLIEFSDRLDKLVEPHMPPEPEAVKKKRKKKEVKTPFMDYMWWMCDESKRMEEAMKNGFDPFGFGG